jgi:hypothetical protein
MNEETTTILIDTALAAGSATALDPEERKLQELVLAVRDDAPVPASDFRLRMDARVAAGFPPRRSRRRLAMPAFAIKRPRLAALGVAASLLLALIVVVSISNRGSSGSTALSTKGPQAVTEAPSTAAPSAGSTELQAQPGVTDAQRAAKTRAAAPAGAPAGGIAPPVGGGQSVGGRSRRVERSAALTLGAPRDQLSDVGDQIIGVTDRYHGFVMRSSITSGSDDQQSGGSFDLRVPVQNLQPTLSDLSKLADVQSRTENADDITASFVSVRTQIQELTALRTSLLKRLANATTDIQAIAIRARLRNVNSQLDYATQQLTRLKRRTHYATVLVTLVAKEKSSGGGGGIGKGARDLRDSLVDAANISLRVLGIAIPIAILIALLWAGNSVVTRRRREAALDSRL